MTGSFRLGAGLFVLLALLTASCASVRFMEDIEAYEGTVEELLEEAAQNPNDPEPLRDLGIIYLRTNDFARANEMLQLAFSRDPDDPKTLFHLGLANEALGRHETALGLYQRYREVSVFSPYRRLMAGRYAHVFRKQVREELQARVAQESGLGAETLEPRVVAVYPLVYRGVDERYAALGRGLAELITIDLGHVEELQLVERVRLQELLDEVGVAQSQHFDPATAPRVGRLIGAGRLVGGVYDVLGTNIQLDAALWAVDRADVADLGNTVGALRNFIQLEKDLVFRVVEEMGVSLNEAERRLIAFVPTENLQAFLAFSRGLEREDAGAFGEAAQLYRQAAALDPGFEAARERAAAAEGQQVVAGPLATALDAAYTADPIPARPFSLDPMGSRLRNLNAALSQPVVPSMDKREPGREAVPLGEVLQPLPDPPDPPPGGGGN